MKDPEMKYMSQQVRTSWSNAKSNYLANPNFTAEKANRLIQLRRKLIAECQKANVGLLLGSDGPQVFNVPGYSIHHELKYLVDAGLTPYQALRTGTVNVAKYLNKKNEGTIANGNASDFVMLNANPLTDINNTKKVEGVMIGTKWLSQEFIAGELKKLEKN
jgi:imidazolonepropionase-like amidohydrolase